MRSNLRRRAPAFCSAFHKHGHTRKLYLNMGRRINSLWRRRANAFEKSALEFPYDGQIASSTLLINNQTFASPNRFRARSLTFSLLWVVAMHDSTDSSGDGWLETIYLQCLKKPSMEIVLLMRNVIIEDKNGEQNYLSLRPSTLNSLKNCFML